MKMIEEEIGKNRVYVYSRRFCYSLSRIAMAGVLFIMSQNVNAEGVRVGKTSMKVSSGENVVFKNDVEVGEGAFLWNDGTVYFNNEIDANLTFNTILSGSGNFYIGGDADCWLGGSENLISSLVVDNNSMVTLNNDLIVSNQLVLRSGIIRTGTSEVKILNASEGAVEFDDVAGNGGFIQGRLKRNTAKGMNCYFPLGTVYEGFNPFGIKDVSSDGYVSVVYEPDFHNQWNTINSGEVKAEEVGGWEVIVDDHDVDFTVDLSLYAYQDKKEALNVLYVPELTSNTDFSLDYNASIRDSKNYLASASKTTPGFYAINKSDVFNGKEDGLQLVNFLVPNGVGRTKFEIPGIEQYKSVLLSVFDRFGNLVYESSRYANDFDSKDYRPGTYYYELVMESTTGEKVLRTNIIEIMEQD